MSLRTRLIIAFVILSVLPLSAVTFLSYLSSVHAFERAAQRETAQSAADIARRMELMTADLGRRMDRLFEVAGTSDSDDPDPDVVRARVAPLLGDAAGLIERVEFHPAGHPPDARKPSPSPGDEHPQPPPGPNPPPPPAAPRQGVIVVDVPRIVEEARRQAQMHAKATGGPDVSGLIDGAAKLAVPVAEMAMSAAADAMRAEAAKEQNAARAAETRVVAQAHAPEMDVKGRRMEVMVKKDGRLVGRANAYMNMDRMLGTVLAFAHREQGEIPFAIDQQDVVHTPDERQRATLHDAQRRQGGHRGGLRIPAAHRRLARRRTARSERTHLRHRASNRTVAPRNPQPVLEEPVARARGDRPGVHRHRTGVAPDDAARLGAERRRASARGR